MPYTNPLVSIIIPSFNRADLITETLESVIAQTYQNWECIVVDDGSTDNTESLLRKLSKKDQRFKFYQRHREPKGAPTCRNIGLEKSNGEYIIFLDSDDLLANFCVDRRVKLFAENPDCDFLVFQTVMFTLTTSDASVYWNVENKEDDLQRFLRTEALWYTGGAIYKRNLIEKVGGFYEGFPFWQDTELGIRLLLKKPVYKKFFEMQPDSFVRQLPGSISRSKTLSEDPVLLSKRIDILFSICNFINANKLKLSAAQADTLLNVLYVLSSRFLIEHNDLRSFRKYWFTSAKLLKSNFLKSRISYLYQLIKYWRKHSIYFIKAGNIYESIFKKFLADDNELKKVLLFNVRFEQHSVLSNPSNVRLGLQIEK